MAEVPVVDIAPLVAAPGGRDRVAAAIDAACRGDGFFYVVGHGVDDGVQSRLEELARAFFALDDAEKAEIAMARGGRAWRGWFPVGGELTSGVPDRKEGIYFGAELGPDHPRVRAGVPLHGPNLFPARPAGFGDAVLAYIGAMRSLGDVLASGLALALGLEPTWFTEHLTAEPTELFRIFHYPPGGEGWGVAEHTDYGLLTILRQDATGGLEIRSGRGWVSAPPVEGSFVCNLGDMVERMTGGAYRSTPHRVRNTGADDRISFAYFFDPSWDAEVGPIPVAVEAGADAAPPRWDGADVHAFSGTYGDYLLDKVAKVFPDLGGEVL